MYHARMERYNMDMKRSLTILLGDDSNRTLEEIGQRQSRAAEEVARDIIERVLAVARLRELRKQLQPYAETAGYHSDDDIMDAIS